MVVRDISVSSQVDKRENRLQMEHLLASAYEQNVPSVHSEHVSNRFIHVHEFQMYTVNIVPCI